MTPLRPVGHRRDPGHHRCRRCSCGPVVVDNQRVPGLRFDAPATQALLSALVVLRLLPNGFANRDLRALLALQLGLDPGAMTRGRMTYHLRRLRLHGLIERIPHTLRYSSSDAGAVISTGDPPGRCEIPDDHVKSCMLWSTHRRTMQRPIPRRHRSKAPPQ